jgi:hypothetical protein
VTSRIHRGFHRIGVVLSGLACILVVWALVQGDALATLILLAAAVAIYAAARAVGWILAGFLTH